MAEIGKCQGEAELISIGTAPSGVEMVSFVVTWDWLTLLLRQDSARYNYIIIILSDYIHPGTSFS